MIIKKKTLVRYVGVSIKMIIFLSYRVYLSSFLFQVRDKNDLYFPILTRKTSTTDLSHYPFSPLR
jgi:hypothetical protein